MKTQKTQAPGVPSSACLKSSAASVAAGLILLGLSLSGALYGQMITEFEFPTGGCATPRGITAGPDGNLWFVTTLTNKIVKMTPSGVMTEFSIPTPNSLPDTITVGPDSNLWFTERAGNRVGRITLAGAIAEFSLPAGLSAPIGITAGPDGNLWFTEYGGDRIGLITTAGSISEFSLPNAGSGPAGITSGPDGALWFTEDSGSRIGRITTAGSINEFALPGGSRPLDIVTGPDGALWFTMHERHSIGRITTAGSITEFPAPTPGIGPREIAVGGEGNLWFTGQHRNRIGRITTAGVVTEFPVPTHRSEPMGITAGPGGHLWFTEKDASKIGRITTASTVRITSITPTSGPAGGGTSTTLTGALFAPGATVTFGGAAGTGVSVPSSSQINATTPARPPGTLNDVVVTNLDASTATLMKGWFAEFPDVPGSHLFRSFIEEIFRSGITVGCGGGNYCPDALVTRAQMAVFLLRGKYNTCFAPPPATGMVFQDVPTSAFAAAWIERLAAEGITSGCSASPPLYCPDDPVTRAQMAVFLIRASYGINFVPPPAVGMFADVPPTDPFARWIEQLARDGVTSGCSVSPPLYCPNDPTTRGQMAVFLVRSFELQ